MNKWVKITLWVVLTPIILLFLIGFTFYIPAVQQFTKKKAIQYGEQVTGMKLSIDQVLIQFPLNVRIKGVYIVSQNDTLLQLDQLIVGIKLIPLLQSKIDLSDFELKNVAFNSAGILKGDTLTGDIERLFIQARDLDLKNNELTVNKLKLSNASLFITLNDTTPPPDTDSKPAIWKIKLYSLLVDQVSVSVKKPADSLFMTTHLGHCEATHFFADLGLKEYDLEQFNLKNSTFSYQQGAQKEATKKFNSDNIALTVNQLTLDSIHYSNHKMSGTLSLQNIKEQSGLEITACEGNINWENRVLKVPTLNLQTPHSEIQINGKVSLVPLSVAFKDVELELKSRIGVADLLFFTDDSLTQKKALLALKPIVLAAKISGNSDQLTLSQSRIEIPNILTFSATGIIETPFDSLNRSIVGLFKSQSTHASQLLPIFNIEPTKSVTLPDVLSLNGTFSKKKEVYQTDLVLREGTGKITLSASYRSKNNQYRLQSSIDSLQLHHFLPNDSIQLLSANLETSGVGVDPFLRQTSNKTVFNLEQLRRNKQSIAHISLEAGLNQGVFFGLSKSNEKDFNFDLALHGSLESKRLKAAISLHVAHLNLKAWGISNDPLTVSSTLKAEIESDLKEENQITIQLTENQLSNGSQLYEPKNAYLSATTSTHLLAAKVETGDLILKLNLHEGLTSATKQIARLSNNIQKQIDQQQLQIDQLMNTFPSFDFDFKAGMDNPLHNYLKLSGNSFNTLNASFSTAQKKVSASLTTTNLNINKWRIDSLNLSLQREHSALNLHGFAINGAKTEYPFEGYLESVLQNNQLTINLKQVDGDQKTALLLGATISKKPEGWSLSFTPDQPILAYTLYDLNSDNQLRLGADNRLQANFNLHTQRGESITLQSNNKSTAKQDINLIVKQINLAGVSQLFSFIPEMSGLVNAKLSYKEVNPINRIINLKLAIDSFSFQKMPIGNLALQTNYYPRNELEDSLLGHFYINKKEVLALEGSVNTQKASMGDLKATLGINAFPLQLINPFIPNQTAILKGSINGNLSIKGTTDQPLLMGNIALDTTSIHITPLGTTFKVDNQPIELKNNRITLTNYKVLSEGKSPFITTGWIDFNNPMQPKTEFQFKASNFELINHKRDKTSLVYGKVYADVDAKIKGPLNALAVQGNIHLLGNTDATYILYDSPLSVQDRMNGLVTFVAFSDTTERVKKLKSNPTHFGGMNLLTTLHIDPTVKLKVDLTPDQASKVELQGGGDLSMQYTPQGEISLTGRYTLSDGLIKYTMPVVGAKLFKIKKESYVDWSGNMMTPKMNIIATEQVKISVALGEERPKMVTFDVSIAVKNSLNDMLLVFDIAAPENGTIQNQLTSMTQEERSKQALLVLITGRYNAPGANTGGTYLNDALSNFLQGQLTNMAGSALKTVDITLGIDTYDSGKEGQSGGKRTDYSFQFAKRFYNDRFQIVIGGKVSSGDKTDEKQNFIDKISFEYRLDSSGSRFIKLFHDTTYESILEGEIIETGVGIVLRKKMKRVNELFNFKKSGTTN